MVALRQLQCADHVLVVLKSTVKRRTQHRFVCLYEIGRWPRCRFLQPVLPRYERLGYSSSHSNGFPSRARPPHKHCQSAAEQPCRAIPEHVLAP